MGQLWRVLSASATSGNVLRLFDTSNPPNGNTGLGSPNELCSPVPGPGVGQGGEPSAPGENCEPQGSVLIIQDEDDDAMPKPNDMGGIIKFNFMDRVQTVHEIGLMDIDTNAVTTITVTFGEGDDQQVQTINVVGLGTNAVQTIPINLDNVSELSVELAASGAVSFLRLCSIPEPPACSAERGFLGFLGVLVSSSIDNGTLDVDWEPAAFVSYNDIEPLVCEDPVYDVFIATAPPGYNYTDANIAELIELAQTSDILVHIRTQELFLSLVDLEPGAKYSILVTASSEDFLYSDNRNDFNITISAVDAVMNRNVTNFFGTFEASEDLIIEYDNSSK